VVFVLRVFLWCVCYDCVWDYVVCFVFVEYVLFLCFVSV